MKTDNLELMKGFISTYGWTHYKTQGVVDTKKVPNHICADFDDDCYALPQTYWNCWEHSPECGVCPFLLQEVSEEIEKIQDGEIK